MKNLLSHIFGTHLALL